MRHQPGNRLERSRDAGDFAIIVGTLLGVLAVIGAAAFAAWSLSADGEKYPTAAAVQTTPPPNF